jgi:hypothetical protein
MALAVYAANQISNRLGMDFGATPQLQELIPAMAQRLGGTLDQITQAMGDLEPLLQEARRFSRI